MRLFMLVIVLTAASVFALNKPGTLRQANQEVRVNRPPRAPGTEGVLLEVGSRIWLIRAGDQSSNESWNEFQTAKAEEDNDQEQHIGVTVGRLEPAFNSDESKLTVRITKFTGEVLEREFDLEAEFLEDLNAIEAKLHQFLSEPTEQDATFAVAAEEICPGGKCIAYGPGGGAQCCSACCPVGRIAQCHSGTICTCRCVPPPQ